MKYKWKIMGQEEENRMLIKIYISIAHWAMLGDTKLIAGYATLLHINQIKENAALNKHMG